MGCDIHSRAEVRRDGKWEAVGEIFPCQHDEWMSMWERRRHPKRKPRIRMSREIYGNRNYELFGVLAGVRSANVGECIALPRGLPADMAHHEEDPWREFQPIDGAYSFGEHSFSWLNLWEILAHSWPPSQRESFATFFHRMHLLLGVIVPANLMREASPFITMALEQDDKDSIDILSEWLADRDLPSLEDVRMVFGFDS